MNPDGTVQRSIRKFVTPKMMLSRWLSWEDDDSANDSVRKYLCKDIDTERQQNVDWAVGAALFMSRDVYARLGGFDQRYFLYMEDEDLCLRAWKQNIPVTYCPAVELIHNHLRASAHLSRNTRYHLVSLLKYFRRHGIGAQR